MKIWNPTPAGPNQLEIFYGKKSRPQQNTGRATPLLGSAHGSAELLQQMRNRLFDIQDPARLNPTSLTEPLSSGQRCFYEDWYDQDKTRVYYSEIEELRGRLHRLGTDPTNLFKKLLNRQPVTTGIRRQTIPENNLRGLLKSDENIFHERNALLEEVEDTSGGITTVFQEILLYNFSVKEAPMFGISLGTLCPRLVEGLPFCVCLSLSYFLNMNGVTLQIDISSFGKPERRIDFSLPPARTAETSGTVVDFGIPTEVARKYNFSVTFSGEEDSRLDIIHYYKDGENHEFDGDFSTLSAMPSIASDLDRVLPPLEHLAKLL